MTKRLFIFAAYDSDNIIDPTLIYYLKSLSGLGDIVFTMDNELSENELNKVAKIPNVLRVSALHHREYDFGSYKRGYIWARDNNVLNNYDWVYLVNDSVLGPLFDLRHTLETLESSGAELTGMTSCYQNQTPLHIQSWFVGLKQEIVKSKLFDDFMLSVVPETEKKRIVFKYEVRLSQIFINNGCNIKTILGPVDCDYVYKDLYGVIKNKIPFIKKYSLKNFWLGDFLWSYLDEKEIVNIQNYAKRQGLKLDNKSITQPYVQIYRLSLLGLPVFSIKYRYCYDCYQYKMYVLDKIPFLKIIKKKKA